MSSNNIKRYNINNPPPPYVKFNRLKCVQEKYEDFMKSLANKNISIKEHINKTIIKDNIFVICKNDFPYNIQNYKHLLLWISPKIKIKVPNYIINMYIYNCLGLQPNKYICFENHPSNKSILNITHYHIFVPV
uniref:Uncharacterized protein n=1 Tax=Megaviridae environmental sample TaxID=1737588 RepID=A0A5J6VK27_9VIRU|nr:MAG: hypothetical protein [Megaviridae environmental sample]